MDTGGGPDAGVAAGDLWYQLEEIVRIDQGEKLESNQKPLFWSTTEDISLETEVKEIGVGKNKNLMLNILQPILFYSLVL